MKQHVLLRISSMLMLLSGIVSLLATVWFTVFGEMLAEEPDPNVNIAIVCAFLFSGMCAILLELVAAVNTIRGDSLARCRTIGVAVVMLSCVAWIAGYNCGQFYYVFIASAFIAALYVMGVKKTIEM